MDQRELKRYLNVIKRAVAIIESMMDHDDNGLLESLSSHVLPIIAQELTTHQITKVEPTPIEIKPLVTITPEQQQARKKHIDELLQIDCWPEAVPPFLVAKDVSVEDQVNRANAVLDMMVDKSLDGLDFLDFGCGDGWIAQQANKRGVKSAVGYDIKTSTTWASIKNVNFTSDFHSIQSSKFDAIMLYDVLDHCIDPILVMSQVKNLLKRDGSVYIRCHPWVSRHATHLYKQGINKSYLHLFLTFDEIKDLINQEPFFTRMEKDPIQAYRWWFDAFEIKKERFVKEPVSEFFHVQSFKELLSNEQQIPLDQIDSFLKLMEIQFVDYKIQLK
jgi:2-polyprenyl-3-methyl-5-hydroxy-6-metoxy-1,4-benzoquinol methylase